MAITSLILIVSVAISSVSVINLAETVRLIVTTEKLV